ncbi:hypothetical protein ACRRTK_017867 [Alexandromys fortis]
MPTGDSQGEGEKRGKRKQLPTSESMTKGAVFSMEEILNTPGTSETNPGSIHAYRTLMQTVSCIVHSSGQTSKNGQGGSDVWRCLALLQVPITVVDNKDQLEKTSGLTILQSGIRPMGTSSSSGLCFQFSLFLGEQWWHPAIESNPELGHGHWYDLVPESLETGLSMEANSRTSTEHTKLPVSHGSFMLPCDSEEELLQFLLSDGTIAMLPCCGLYKDEKIRVGTRTLWTFCT